MSIRMKLAVLLAKLSCKLARNNEVLLRIRHELDGIEFDRYRLAFKAVLPLYANVDDELTMNGKRNKASRLDFDRVRKKAVEIYCSENSRNTEERFWLLELCYRDFYFSQAIQYELSDEVHRL